MRHTASSPTGEAIHEPEGLAPDQSTLAPGLRLIPSNVRSDVYRLYDVLRKLDDLVDDDQPEAAQRLDAVEAWTRGEPPDTYETHVLADLAQRHELPKQALLDFCHGMRHDIARAVIYTEEDLELYSQRAGGSVGIMLARLLGSTNPETERKMATLGRAMQRTNILRESTKTPPTTVSTSHKARSSASERLHQAPEQTSSATKSPVQTRSIRKQEEPHRCSPAANEAWRSAPSSTERSCAKSNETATDTHPDVPSCQLGVDDCSSQSIVFASTSDRPCPGASQLDANKGPARPPSSQRDTRRSPESIQDMVCTGHSETLALD